MEFTIQGILVKTNISITKQSDIIFNCNCGKRGKLFHKGSCGYCGTRVSLKEVTDES